MNSVKLLGVPFDFGQPHSGLRQTPDFLRKEGLLTLLSEIAPLEDLGNISFAPKISEGPEDIRHGSEASIASQMLSRRIEEENLSNAFLLNIGGDHGLGLGSVHGILSHRPETLCIWVDAHGDLNTPATTPSKNFHGMPLAFLLRAAKHPHFSWMRHFLLPHKLILIGPRDLDPEEGDLIDRERITYFSSQALNRLGARDVLEMALHSVDPFGILPIHLSFDVDVFDQHDLPSTGTKVSHGPRLEELFLLGGLIAETGRLKSMDVVELNPEIGSSKDVLASAELTLDFIRATIKQVFMQATPSPELFRRASTSEFYQA